MIFPNEPSLMISKEEIGVINSTFSFSVIIFLTFVLFFFMGQ